jgi:eukaryotic-like serine/threonine-protein kinase
MEMGPDRWATVERLYHAALTCPVEGRVAFLAKACAGDDALRHEVESLLAQGASGADALTRGAVVAAAGLISDAGTSTMTGRRIGVYQILAPIGAGGMGEVYRARDTRLGRDVAIKILPAEFTSNPDRLARFEREARVLASLNHPHIGAIYGIEDALAESGSRLRALVLELVEGETLAERIARRKGAGLPLSEALDISRQIADALDAAHEKGIVHRDLKPANIKITPENVVKVLDFGLAKLEVLASGDGGTASPTITVGDTRGGLVIGTAAYMSPEQARGQAVDKRSDIWAFGCVLYEMLTGSAAFARETLSDTLAAVIEREPDWTRLPSTTPVNVNRIAQRCLAKDPRRRLRDIADAAVELDPDAVPLPIAPTPLAAHSRRGYVAGSIAAVLIAALGIAAWSFRGSRDVPPVSGAVTRTTIILPGNQRLATADSDYPLAVSPDGATFAYVAEHEGQTQLYVRELGALEPRAIPGATAPRHPFFSPDGKWVGFFAGGALQKVAVASGVPLRICSVTGRSMGASWGPDDTIVWATLGADLSKVSAGGGLPQPIVGSSPAAWPEILPDGKTVLFTTGAAQEASAIAAQSLDGGTKRIVARTTDSPLQGPAVLGAGDGIAQVRIVANGHYLVYGQSQNPGAIRAIPFDLTSLTAKGSPLSLADSVERARNGGAVYFAVSTTGLLLYASTGDRHQLAWVDRNGTATPISSDRAAFRSPDLSPDGTLIVVAVNDETRRSDIWIYDADRGTKRRLTTERHNLSPVWTPDGRRITFSAGGIVELTADTSGTTATLFSLEQVHAHLLAGTFAYPTAWSPDGRDLLFQADGRDVWALSRLTPADPHPLLQGPFNEHNAQFSPDGRWIVYVSDESGHDEIYVRPYHGFTSPFVVSSDGGTYPRWSRDGREIFYRQGDALMAVSVEANQSFHADKPRRLFTGPFTGAGRESSFAVSPDGKRFVMVKSDEASTLTQLTVVQNWFPGLK